MSNQSSEKQHKLKDLTYGGPVVRHLIYYIWPTAHSDVWRWNVSQLLRRMDQFNGKRIVAIATDDKAVSFDECKAAFQGTVTDFRHYANDPKRGETVAFLDLLKSVQSTDQREVVTYCQAKGVKYPADTKHMVRRWTETMYSSLLDYPLLIEDTLLTHQMVGTFLKSGNTFDGLPPAWHYAGTLFWFRSAAIFSNPNWQHIPTQWWGTEAWPGIVCPREAAACLVMEGVAPTMHLYARKYWREVVNPIWQDWQIKHASLRRHCSYSEVCNSLRGQRKIIVSGPQRSGTVIASKMLAKDLGLPFVEETAFGTHDFGAFQRILEKQSTFVVQAPTMSAYLHLLPYPCVFMRRNLQDILRSQKRIGWEEFEQLEKDRYFDHSKRPAAVVKTEAWERFQRIALGSNAFDLDYESLAGHSLWVNPEKRKAFGPRQTGYTQN
jgi:hypothetical protein